MKPPIKPRSQLADLCEDGWHTTMCGRCGCCACQCCPVCHRCTGSDCGNGCKGHEGSS